MLLLNSINRQNQMLSMKVIGNISMIKLTAKSILFFISPETVDIIAESRIFFQYCFEL